ncbi:hypothetical protein [Hyalangium versicolor]|uniref:hypothetical protein n=1 Tax=Hyalangium versicolor TaxID=2861190 RepID=UPI001CCB1686|nr:hypothetical protein [Hyalangium versicolor]
MAGCATSPQGLRPSSIQREAPSPELAEGSGGSGFWEKRDDFQLLQQAAGLNEDSKHQEGEELKADSAQALWKALARTPTTLQNFGPRRCLVSVLRQVLARDNVTSYPELLQQFRPFRSLAVMRPDGYLVSALAGTPFQRMGHVQLREGRLMAGAFEVGAFYRDRGGVFYAVDKVLLQPGAMVGELGLERDWLSAALDGSEEALVEVGRSLAQLITSPVRSIQGVKQLPSAVAALIVSSPAYFAHYSALPLQEQIREAARISMHLLLLYGSASGTATRLGMTGTTLPMLSLTAEGTLALERVAIPISATGTALGTGVGAVYVLMESTKPPGQDNPASATDTAKNVTLPDKRAGHIFRDAPGHLKDTPANRQLLKDVANDPGARLGTDKFGNRWSARTNPDGTQTWVQIRNGEIINGGVNPTPRMFHPETGLSALKPIRG